MKTELLDEIERLDAAATPGPWETSDDLDIGASNSRLMGEVRVAE